MRIYRLMFAAATAPLSPPGLTTGRGAAASFAAGVSLAPSRHVAHFFEIIVFAMLLALVAPSAGPRQTFTVSSVTATPATVQPGHSVVVDATITAHSERLELSGRIFVGPTLLALTPRKLYSPQRFRRARP